MQRQEVLAQAVKISPRSCQRQRALGESSSANAEHDQAVHAWRAALRHSKNTCQEIPEDYLFLANSLNDLATVSRGTQVDELNQEALNILKLVEKKYPRHPVVQLRSKQIRAEVFDIQGKVGEYKKELMKALEIQASLDYNALRTTSVKLCIDSARAFMDHGYYEEGEAILEELAALTDEHELSIQIDKLRREPQTLEGISYASTLNKSGIEFYEKRELAKAQQAFEKVLDELPNHTGLNLNLLQVLVTRKQEEELNEKDMHLLTTCFRRVKHLNEASPHFKRYHYLKEKCQPLHDDAALTEVFK